MYKRNKQFPGIDGLVKEKNQNRAKNSSSVESNMFNDFGQEVKALYVTDSPFQQNSQISFKGRIENVFKTLDFNGHNPPHLILGFYTLGIMLGARLYQARNRDERREVATRDFSGLSTIIFALPLFRNIVATFIRKTTGFPISQVINTIKGHFKAKRLSFSFENIDDIYSGISKYKNNIVDFAENISNHQGDLRKIFDFLSDKSKSALNQIASDFSSNNSPVKSDNFYKFITKPFRAGNSELILPNTNEEIIEMLKKAQKDKNLQPLVLQVIKEIDTKGNHLVKFAQGLKSIPEAICIIGVAAFLGWFLPWFNINYTRKLYQNKNNKEKKQVYA